MRPRSALLLLAALSSLIGGLLFEGAAPLVGLGGAELPSGEAALLLLCSWLLSLLPLIAFVVIAILLSIASRSGIVGVGGTVIAGLLMQLLGFLGHGSWAHALLLGAAFDDWHGLLAEPGFFAPMAIALAVSVAWTVAALAGAWLLFHRRDFAGPPVTRLRGWLPTARLVLVAAIAFVALAAVSELGSTAITGARLQRVDRADLRTAHEPPAARARRTGARGLASEPQATLHAAQRRARRSRRRLALHRDAGFPAAWLQPLFAHGSHIRRER